MELEKDVIAVLLLNIVDGMYIGHCDTRRLLFVNFMQFTDNIQFSLANSIAFVLVKGQSRNTIVFQDMPFQRNPLIVPMSYI